MVMNELNALEKLVRKAEPCSFEQIRGCHAQDQMFLCCDDPPYSVRETCDNANDVASCKFSFQEVGVDIELVLFSNLEDHLDTFVRSLGTANCRWQLS